MSHLSIAWPFGPGISVPNIPVSIKQVNVMIDQQSITLTLAALDSTGGPLDGQYASIPMPKEVFAQFAASQTQAMLQALISLPSTYFAGLGVPDFSTATIVVDTESAATIVVGKPTEPAATIVAGPA